MKFKVIKYQCFVYKRREAIIVEWAPVGLIAPLDVDLILGSPKRFLHFCMGVL